MFEKSEFEETQRLIKEGKKNKVQNQGHFI